MPNISPQQSGEIEDIFAEQNSGNSTAGTLESYPTQPQTPPAPPLAAVTAFPKNPIATPSPVTPPSSNQPVIEDMFEPQAPVVEPLASAIPYGSPPSGQVPEPVDDQQTPATLPPLLGATPVFDERSVGATLPPTDKRRPSQRRVGRGSRIRLIILMVSILILIVVLVWAYGPRLWGRDKQQNTVDSTLQNINQVTPVNDTTIQNNTNQDITPSNQDTIIIDSDGDGLLDSEESVLKTDPSKIDSDNDGLSDRQEVRVYKTNPRKADTDGDGYDDAEEVRNFYDPNGPGKLPSVVDAIDEFNAQQNTNNQNTNNQEQ